MAAPGQEAGRFFFAVTAAMVPHHAPRPLSSPAAMKARLARTLLAAFAALPFRLAQSAGTAFGLLHWILPNRARRNSERNIEGCFPDRPRAWRRRLLRRSLAATGRTLAESLWLWGRDPDDALELVREVHGTEHLDRARAQGRGVIVCTPHFGAWELAAAWGARQMPLTVLFRPPRAAALAAPLRAARERVGVRPVPTDAGGIRSLYRALRAGEAIAILPDQLPRSGQGVFAPFFGRPALTMTLVSRLAESSGAPVLMAAMERLPCGRGFHMHLWPADPEVSAPDATRAATAINREIERCVALAPEQYMWNYKRFPQKPAAND